jgi:hypothetical protein
MQGIDLDKMIRSTQTKPKPTHECTCDYQNRKVLFRGIYMCWPCLLKAVRQMHLEHDEECAE